MQIKGCWRQGFSLGRPGFGPGFVDIFRLTVEGSIDQGHDFWNCDRPIGSCRARSSNYDHAC